MDSTKSISNETSEEDAKIKSDLFNLVEKLRIELQKKDRELQVKDEELAKEKQEKQKLAADLEMEKAQANEWENHAYDLHSGLTNAHQTIHVLQMCLWTSFPSPDIAYYIKTQSGLQNGQFRYLYVESKTHYLRASAVASRSKFKFAKNADDSFSIYRTKGSYLQTNGSSRVGFTDNDGNAEKFVLVFHQQNQQTGLLVDICSMAGHFLCVDNDNHIVANARIQPADKFLIIPVGVE